MGEGEWVELTQSINLPFQKYLDALNTISEGVEFHILSQAAGDIWIVFKLVKILLHTNV